MAQCQSGNKPLAPSVMRSPAQNFFFFFFFFSTQYHSQIFSYCIRKDQILFVLTVMVVVLFLNSDRVWLTNCDPNPRWPSHSWWPGARRQQAISFTSADLFSMGHKWLTTNSWSHLPCHVRYGWLTVTQYLRLTYSGWPGAKWQQAIGSTSTARFAMGHRELTTSGKSLALWWWGWFTNGDPVPSWLSYGRWPGAKQQQAIGCTSADHIAGGHKELATPYQSPALSCLVQFTNCDPVPGWLSCSSWPDAKRQQAISCTSADQIAVGHKELAATPE